MGCLRRAGARSPPSLATHTSAILLGEAPAQRVAYTHALIAGEVVAALAAAAVEASLAKCALRLGHATHGSEHGIVREAHGVTRLILGVGLDVGRDRDGRVDAREVADDRVIAISGAEVAVRTRKRRKRALPGHAHNGEIEGGEAVETVEAAAAGRRLLWQHLRHLRRWQDPRPLCAEDVVGQPCDYRRRPD
eukprot:scaffold30641_cov129-Isochrysis_galbana.AAC.1